MATKKTAPKTDTTTDVMPETKADLLARYECNGFKFPNRDYYDRHVVFDHVVGMDGATQRERFEAVARTLRDVLTQRWLKTAETYLRSAIAQPGADSRVRQNLALVVGLQGRFQEAENIARQELTAEQAEANMAYLKAMLAQDNNWQKLSANEDDNTN